MKQADLGPKINILTFNILKGQFDGLQFIYLGK